MTLQKRIHEEKGLPVAAADPPVSPTESIFDLEVVLRLLRTRWHIIAGTVILATAVAALLVYRMTPLYTATALVLMDTKQNRMVSATTMSDQPSEIYLNTAAIENQVQILYSRNLASLVVDKLRLDLDPEFNPLLTQRNEAAGASGEADAQRADDERQYLINRVLGGVTARTRGLSSAIEISYVDADPKRAHQLANALATAFVEDQLNAKFQASEVATRFLTNRVQELAQQVRDADVAVQQYRAENNLTDAGGGVSILEQQLSALNGQLIVARSDLAEKEAMATRVAELRAAGREEDISQVVASPLINNLRTQETALLQREADYASRYGPRHPRVLDLEAEKRNLMAKIAEEVTRVVETVTNDVAIARARVRSLEASLAQATGRSTGDNLARVKLKELEANAATSHAMYDTFLSRIKETQGQDVIQMPDARVISPAVLPGGPSSPNKPRALQLGAASGLVLGFLLALLVERLDSGFRTASQVEKTLGLPVLSTIPELGRKGRWTGVASQRVIDKPMSSFTEAVRGLQMGLVLSNVDKPPKVILVTSALPSEGKTTAAVSLARLAATNDKKVLVIDCDLRRPAAAKAFGSTKFEKGLVEVLSGQAKLEDCLLKDPHSSLQFLPTRIDIGNPPDILGSEAIEKLIGGLRNKYDLIVIDSAPLLPVNDTRILVRLADAVVFVVRWEKTPRDAARAAARILGDIRAPVAGIAMTRANTARFHYYSYGYQSYTSYNKYYTS